MNAQLVNQRVSIIHNGWSVERRVQIWRHADGTIVLDDGVNRIVQRPTSPSVSVSLHAFLAFAREIRRLVRLHLSSL